MTARERVIVELLEKLPDLVDPMQTRSGQGDGEPLPLCPATHTRTVRELERLLARMRDDRATPLVRLDSGEKVSVRALWWHVRAWYVDCDRHPYAAAKPRYEARKGRKLVKPKVDRYGRLIPVVREPRRQKGARLEVARAGVTWLADAFPFEPKPAFEHGPRGYRLGCRCGEIGGECRKPRERVAA